MCVYCHGVEPKLGFGRKFRHLLKRLEPTSNGDEIDDFHPKRKRKRIMREEEGVATSLRRTTRGEGGHDIGAGHCPKLFPEHRSMDKAHAGAYGRYIIAGYRRRSILTPLCYGTMTVRVYNCVGQ